MSLTTVISETRDLPLCHGTRVSPSRYFPSDRHKPCSSLKLGVTAAESARATRGHGDESICLSFPAYKSVAAVLQPTVTLMCGVNKCKKTVVL